MSLKIPRITYCLVFVTFCNSIFAWQDLSKVDSLLVLYENDTLTLEERFHISRELGHEHPEAALALGYSKEALDLAIEIGDPLLKAYAFEELGANQRLLGNLSEALSSTLQALKIFESLNEKLYMAASYAQLGSNLMSDGEPLSAVKYLEESARIYKSNEEYINYSLALINLGEAYRLANQLDSAIYNFELALSLNDSLKNEIIEGYARGNLGMALRSNGELAAAKSELTKANEILTELGDPYSVSVYTADLAQISIAEGKSTLAEDQLLTAYNMAKDEGLKEQIRDFSEMLVDFYETRQSYSLALEYQKVYQVYQDSLVNKENVQQMERIKANYEIDKRERDIDLLSQVNAKQQNFNLALGGGILLIGIFAVLLYQSNQQKNEANGMLSKQQVIVMKREEEKATLLKELNHRVKNNLQMVSSLLSLQGNQLEGHPAAEAINAGKLRVEALSMIHQKLYQDDVHTSIGIKDHLVQLVSNLLYSYGDPFEPAITVVPEDLQMDIDTAIPLSLIVNELVTNAMKYAYEGIENPEMLIKLVKPNGHYLLDFSDNGVGIDHEKDTSNSFGLRLVRSLVEQLNGTLTMTDVPTGGTAWIITLRAPENTES